MNVEGYWKNYKKDICIDQWLKAAGMRAQTEGDAAAAKECLGPVCEIECGRKPLSVLVDVESSTSVIEQVNRMACDKDLFTTAERARMRKFTKMFSAHAGTKSDMEGLQWNS